MKSLFTKFTLFALFIASFGANKVFSQDFGDVLAAGARDASTYLENYAGPGINAFGNAMTEGWYNTAKPHKTLGFNLTVSPSIAVIPQSDKFFEFVESNYDNLILEINGAQTNNVSLPTMFGPDAAANSELVVEAGTTVDYPGSGPIALTGEQRFPVPNGLIDLGKIPFAGAPAPTYNLGIGIYKNTDLKLRLSPELSFGDFRVKMFGIGVMHDVKQWIPGIKNLPFDLSALIATSTLTMEYDVDVSTGDATSSFVGTGTAIFKSSATTVQGIISKKLLFFTPYAAIGFNVVKSTFDVNGEYTYSDMVNGEQTINDPIALEFTGAGSMRASIGAQIKLLIFTFHGAYTLQKYNTVSIGMGISVR